MFVYVSCMYVQMVVINILAAIVLHIQQTPFIPRTVVAFALVLSVDVVLVVVVVLGCHC